MTEYIVLVMATCSLGSQLDLHENKQKKPVLHLYTLYTHALQLLLVV